MTFCRSLKKKARLFYAPEHPGAKHEVMQSEFCITPSATQLHAQQPELRQGLQLRIALDATQRR